MSTVTEDTNQQPRAGSPTSAATISQQISPVSAPAAQHLHLSTGPPLIPATLSAFVPCSPSQLWMIRDTWLWAVDFWMPLWTHRLRYTIPQTTLGRLFQHLHSTRNHLPLYQIFSFCKLMFCMLDEIDTEVSWSPLTNQRLGSMVENCKNEKNTHLASSTLICSRCNIGTTLNKPHQAIHSS